MPVPIALNDAQRMLVDSLTAWAERARPIDEVRRAADAGVPVSPAASPAWRGAAEIGVPGICVPERFGGADGLVADVVVGVATLAGALTPGPVASTAAVTALLACCPGPVAEAVLPVLAEGRAYAAIALGGAGVYGSDASAGDLRADGGAGLAAGADKSDRSHVVL
ncbi:hypothetical protein GCM10023147_19560 [Tsukamurella soli]|uniref:Acyl-CoA dehydrogenase/oxidase N-terminal domain-containing protein n=1 Tax=Tsukamurella soli TaxID=644556 RepID=A0ABP8JHU5_9ACTN